MDGYGAWEAIYAVSILMGVFQSTMGGVLLWRFSQAFGRQSHQEMQRVVSYGLFTAILMFLFMTPLAWLLRERIAESLQIPAGFRQTATIAIPCIVGCMSFGAMGEVFAAILSGSQRAGIANMLVATGNLVNNLVSLIALTTGLGFWSLVIGYGVGVLFTVTAVFFVSRKFLGEFHLVPRPPPIDELRRSRHYVGFMLMHGAAVAFRDQLDKLVIAAFSTTASTAQFSLAARLAGFVPLVCGFIYTPVIAAAGALHSRGDEAGLKRLYLDTTVIVGVLVGFCSVILASLGDRLIVLWVGHADPQVTDLLRILLVGSTTAVLLTGAGTAMCKGVGMVRMEGIYILVMLALNCVLKPLLIRAIGSSGTVIASSLSWALSSILFASLLHKAIPAIRAGIHKSVQMLGVFAGCSLIGVYLIPAIPVNAGRKDAVLSLLIYSPIILSISIFVLILVGVVPLKHILEKCNRYLARRVE